MLDGPSSLVRKEGGRDFRAVGGNNGLLVLDNGPSNLRGGVILFGVGDPESEISPSELDDVEKTDAFRLKSDNEGDIIASGEDVGLCMAKKCSGPLD